MPDVCTYLQGSHDYSMFWQTTTPSIDDMNTRTFENSMSPGHNLNPVSKCGLTSGRVLDTTEMLDQLQEEHVERAKLYLNKYLLVVDA